MSKVVEGKLLDQTEKKGSLYSYQSGNLKTFVTEVGVSNGLAFNVELKKFYYIDSFKRTVDEFDFDIGSGSIANRKAIFSFNSHELPGSPDGMTIDTDGNLWVAVMAGSRVIKIDPRKPETLLDTVILPTKLVTSVAFGGKKLDELYVTTGKLPTDESTSDDGAIYKITGLNARGFPGVSVIL
ncbi:hypothetical protein NQ318_011749 [Aromia moschata]|uniref:SMP-30/Gluconolactonase/LRE-like region domain-containing protein n=1 Tax=Aromia moschata TaxID=1265417 RepID=A0AAV8Y1T8_9CUCU|nr:hypothetical protein NQ318_011749 [Aromia moschata]